MSVRIGFLFIALAIVLAGCDPAYVAPNAVVAGPVVAVPAVVGAAAGPVAVMTQNRDILTGQAATTANGGTFHVARGGLQCTGTYDPSPGQQTLTVGARCSDGRFGIGTAIRETPASGRGTIRMSDGTQAVFVFGAPAAALAR